MGIEPISNQLVKGIFLISDSQEVDISLEMGFIWWGREGGVGSANQVGLLAFVGLEKLVQRVQLSWRYCASSSTTLRLVGVDLVNMLITSGQ